MKGVKGERQEREDTNQMPKGTRHRKERQKEFNKRGDSIKNQRVTKMNSKIILEFNRTMRIYTK